MSKLLGFLLALALAANCAASTNFIYNATIDLSAGTMFQYTNTGLSSFLVNFGASARSFNLATGDSISGTILFTNGQLAVVTDPPGTNSENTSIVFLQGLPHLPATCQFTLQLLGVSGGLNAPNPYTGSSQSSAAQSWNTFATMIGLTTNTLAYTGFNYTFKLMSGPTPVTFTPLDFQINAGLSNIGFSAPVQIVTSNANFGVRSNAFGFDVTASSNLTVVVEATTNLPAPAWQPLRTNIPPFYFSDPTWTNFPQKFYRARLQ